MLSYWEQQNFTNYEYAVIGGGVVGLSTAISLKELDPAATVVVLDRGIFPRGASTRNAGFACFGSLTELLADLDSMGPQATRQLVADRWSGLSLLRSRIGDDKLGYEHHGGYELLFSGDMDSLQRLDEVNKLLWPVFDQPVFSINHQLISEFGFNQHQVAGIAVNSLEGQLDPAKMIWELIQLARSMGVDYRTGANVQHFEPIQGGVSLKVTGGADTAGAAPEIVQLQAKKIAVCTNAFTNQLVPVLELRPGRGQVLITDEIPGLKFRGAFHYQQGFYYFRNVGTRILFGGGRNLDFETESTTEFGINNQIAKHLEHELSELILPDTQFQVASRWSGIMAFGEHKTPLVGLHSPDIGYAVRLGGMGVALGSLVADRLARLICLNAENA